MTLLDHLHSGTLSHKLAAAAIMSPLLLWLERYLMPDPSFLFVFAVLIALDTATGIYAARATGQQIQSKRLREALTKVIVYAIVLGIVHMVRVWATSSVPSGVFASAAFSAIAWIDYLVYGFCLIVEAISIVENLNKFSKNPLLKVIGRFLHVTKDRLQDAIEQDKEPPKA